MSVWVELFHGRDSEDEELDDWGFDGPVVGPFDFVQNTYGIDIRGIRKSKDNEEEIHEFPMKDGLIQYDGKWYGDYSVFDDALILRNLGVFSPRMKVV
jgi:hypothetical protein